MEEHKSALASSVHAVSTHTSASSSHEGMLPPAGIDNEDVLVQVVPQINAHSLDDSDVSFNDSGSDFS